MIFKVSFETLSGGERGSEAFIISLVIEGFSICYLITGSLDFQSLFLNYVKVRDKSLIEYILNVESQSFTYFEVNRGKDLNKLTR